MNLKERSKHNYYIEFESSPMEMEFSEIIHRGKSLPTEINYVLYTIDDNQKIVEINLYTYKDEGVKEKV